MTDTTYERDGKASFFAFISHKHIDSRFALKLQKFIESYQLPTAIRKIVNAPKRLTPICSYEIDFSSKPLFDEMRDKLRQSNYLILLCSEGLIRGGTKYVNYEIETFIECKREQGIDPIERIIPIIVDGEFGSAEHECCPEALKALGENCPIAIDCAKYKNEREVFLHVISAMLNIDYAVLHNRDKKRMRNRMVTRAAVLVACLAVALGLADYFIPKKHHYLDFVMQNGLPVGIEALSASERKVVAKHYVITECQRKIVSLEYVNSYGNPIEHDNLWYSGDRPCRYEFGYVGDVLSTVTYYNRDGHPYLLMQYAGNSLEAVELRDPAQPSVPYYLGHGIDTDLSGAMAPYSENNRTDISRFRYEYDENGFVVKTLFHADSSGRLANDNGVYGFAYETDEQGRIVARYFLDENGNRRVNSEGIFCIRYVYDEHNNLCEYQNLDQTGALIENSDLIMHMRRSFDENHNINGLTFLDRDGNLKYSEYGGAKMVYQLNKRGNRVSVLYLDEQEQPIDTLGFCEIRNAYDKNGNIIAESYADKSGNLVKRSDLDYATVRYTVDDAGRVTERTYYDTEGQLTDTSDRYAREVLEYDERGFLLGISYFASDGTAAKHRCGGHSVVSYKYDQFGRELSVSYFDGERKPVLLGTGAGAHGYHSIVRTYDFGAYTKVTIGYCGTDGKPINHTQKNGSESYASVELVFQGGQITSMVKYGENGVQLGDRYEIKVEYNALAERVSTRKDYDPYGKLTKTEVTVESLRGVVISTEVSKYDANGNVADKAAVQRREDGTLQSYCRYEYENGVETYLQQETYNTDEKLVRNEITYDGILLLEDYVYASDGSYTMTRALYELESGRLIGSEELHYDRFGNQIP